MWTNENRARYDRSKLRYPSDLTDEEWAIIAPLIPPAKKGGNKRTVDERGLVDGLVYILSTGCQWAALPTDLPARSTVNAYFRYHVVAATSRRFGCGSMPSTISFVGFQKGSGDGRAACDRHVA